MTDRVVGFTLLNERIAGAMLAGGYSFQSDFFVNAAGAWAGQVSAMAGMVLPVSPLRRFEHYFTGHRQIEPLPYVKDLERLAFRSEGQGFSGGLVNSKEPRGFNFDADHCYFDEVARIVREMPGMEAATIVALTGWGAERDRELAKKAGFDDHLTKPASRASVNLLLSKIHRLQ